MSPADYRIDRVLYTTSVPGPCVTACMPGQPGMWQQVPAQYSASPIHHLQHQIIPTAPDRCRHRNGQIPPHLRAHPQTKTQARVTPPTPQKTGGVNVTQPTCTQVRWRWLHGNDDNGSLEQSSAMGCLEYNRCGGERGHVTSHARTCDRRVMLLREVLLAVRLPHLPLDSPPPSPLPWGHLVTNPTGDRGGTVARAAWTAHGCGAWVWPLHPSWTLPSWTLPFL